MESARCDLLTAYVCPELPRFEFSAEIWDTAALAKSLAK